jgi:predicted O-methyltransferase YrrM
VSIKQKIFQAGAYLNYWLVAVSQHSLHPPFIYELYTRAIKPDKKEPAFAPIEQLRQALRMNNELLQLRELGAGSSVNKSSFRPVSDIARHSLTTARFSRLLYRLIRHMQASTILELGSSLGINTLYLAAAAPQGQVYTFEGCPQTAAMAREVFAQYSAARKPDGTHSAANIRLIEGPIDHTLPSLLQQPGIKIDGAYIDANHTYEASIRYFELLLPYVQEKSFLVFDDIYWSPGMKKAWNEMQQHPRVSLSLDLYHAGILFFQPSLQPAHYVVS